MALLSTFGKTPSGARLERMRRSGHYKDSKFENLTPTTVTLPGVSIFSMIREMRNRPDDVKPPRVLPAVRTDLRALPDDAVSIVWFGHSSYLLKVYTTTILVDPVFSGNASPVSFFAKAFPASVNYGVSDMPDIDVLLLTHDHYDHLDYKTVKELISKTKRFFTSLGVGAHLEYWGVANERIVELDWWESGSLGGEITVTATPARHFSGRSFKRGGTAWSSFVLQVRDVRLFLGGDSGYETHFAEIGNKYGPFDLAILECGQYGKNWPYIHMLPEQTVQAALDLKAKRLMPVHWGKFTLALHPWDEPIRRVVVAAEAAGVPITTPLIGEPVVVNQHYPHLDWWNNV